MMRFTQKFPLTIAQERFVLLLIVWGVKLPEIWRKLVSPDKRRRNGLPRYTGNYHAFHARIKRLCQPPKRTTMF